MHAQGRPPVRRHGFIKSKPLEGRAAPSPWWWCLLDHLCFLCRCFNLKGLILPYYKFHKHYFLIHLGVHHTERGVMVAMGHGLCVCFCACGETTKNEVGPKQSQCFLEIIDRVRLAKVKLADNMARSINDKMLVWTKLLGIPDVKKGEEEIDLVSFI